MVSRTVIIVFGVIFVILSVIFFYNYLNNVFNIQVLYGLSICLIIIGISLIFAFPINSTKNNNDLHSETSKVLSETMEKEKYCKCKCEEKLK